MSEGEAGWGVVLLQRLAQLKEAREVLGEFAEARLVRCRLAVVQVIATSRDGNGEPVVALLAGLCGSVGPSAILLAEIIGDVVHLQRFGREQLRRRMQAPDQIEARASVRGDGSLRLHVLEGLAEYVH